MQRKVSSRLSAFFHCLLVLMILIVPSAVVAYGAEQTWHAIVGAQSKDKGTQANAFLPNEVWIYDGDSISWKFATDEVHTVSLLTPGQIRPAFNGPTPGCPGIPGGATASPATYDGSACINSGPLLKAPGGTTYTVTFPKAGNYKLVCLVHANMTGVVHVLDHLLAVNHPLPFNQAFYEDQADDVARSLLSDTDKHEKDEDEGRETRAFRSFFSRNEVTAGIGEVVATGGGTQFVSIMRFLQETIRIRVGETVEWTNLDPSDPHTITFGTEPAVPVPPSAGVVVDTDGARHATISSASPIPDVNSGFIAASPQDAVGRTQAPAGVTRFRVTFTVPGTFNYYCALHDDLGMVGKVIVTK